jgi:hypothetical protein
MIHLYIAFWCLIGIGFCGLTLYTGILLYQDERRKNGD